VANDLDSYIRSAAQKIVQYVGDVATLTVQTEYVPLEPDSVANFDQSKPIARTIIRIDGDCNAVVPVVTASGGRLEVDAALFDLHQRNVTTAIEYRARILNALLQAVSSRFE
jgi:hypothetical protein